MLKAIGFITALFILFCFQGSYGQVITDYVNTFPVYTDRYDCKIVETHILLGDPSLKIGGYP